MASDNTSKKQKMSEAITRQLGDRFSSTQNMAPLIDEFIERDLAEPNFIGHLETGGDQFYQAFWEFLVGSYLIESGFAPQRLPRGPDFLVRVGDNDVFIECQVPLPANLPKEWMEREIGKAYSVPTQAIKLRWTGALYNKKQQLEAWLKKGVLRTPLAYVIAINGGLLAPRMGLAEDFGISQFPLAAEITYPLGPLAVDIDDDLQNGSIRRTIESNLRKANRAKVDVDVFLRTDWSSVSGVMGAASFAPLELKRRIHWVPNINASVSLEDNWCQAPCWISLQNDGDLVHLELRGVQ